MNCSRGHTGAPVCEIGQLHRALGYILRPLYWIKYNSACAASYKNKYRLIADRGILNYWNVQHNKKQWSHPRDGELNFRAARYLYQKSRDNGLPCDVKSPQRLCGKEGVLDIKDTEYITIQVPFCYTKAENWGPKLSFHECCLHKHFYFYNLVQINMLILCTFLKIAQNQYIFSTYSAPKINLGKFCRLH